MDQTCPACGTAQAADASFCTACGHALAASAREPEVEHLLPEQPADAVPTGGRGSRRVLGLALVAAVVLALGGTALFLLLRDSDADKVEDAVRSYVAAVDDNDCDALVDVIQLPEVTDAELKEQCEDEDEGTDEDVDVLEVAVSKVEVTDGGTRASARLEVTYTDEDGRDTDTETVLLREVDGDWEITGFEE